GYRHLLMPLGPEAAAPEPVFPTRHGGSAAGRRDPAGFPAAARGCGPRCGRGGAARRRAVGTPPRAGHRWGHRWVRHPPQPGAQARPAGGNCYEAPPPFPSWTMASEEFMPTDETAALTDLSAADSAERRAEPRLTCGKVNICRVLIRPSFRTHYALLDSVSARG